MKVCLFSQVSRMNISSKNRNNKWISICLNIEFHDVNCCEVVVHKTLVSPLNLSY